MDDVPQLPSMEAEGKRRHAEARLRALHEKWPSAQIYSTEAPVRGIQPSPDRDADSSGGVDVEPNKDVK